MSSCPDLRLDWCSYEAARYAVMRWHYSRRMPSCKLARLGVWEGGAFIGAVVFGLGATPNLCKPYGLAPIQVCELVRVALRTHRAPVSRIIAIALRLLKREFAGLRLVVSFADTAQGHHGGIYQASGWIYLGVGSADPYYRLHGRIVHPRTVHSKYGNRALPWLRAHVDPGAHFVRVPLKYKYAMPLDRELRGKLVPLAQPYPKRGGSETDDTPGVQSGKGGSTPTPPLHSESVRA